MSLSLKVSDIKEMLEPVILYPHASDEDLHTVTPDHIAISQAHSLKRIADLLEAHRLDDGQVITLPQILMSIALPLRGIHEALMLPGVDHGRLNLAEVIDAIRQSLEP